MRSEPNRNGAAAHAAVVCSFNEVLFLAVSSSADALRGRLAEYVRANAPRTRFPDDARRVPELLAGGRAQSAIELYFARIGRRWDPEHLYVTVGHPA